MEHSENMAKSWSSLVIGCVVIVPFLRFQGDAKVRYVLSNKNSSYKNIACCVAQRCKPLFKCAFIRLSTMCLLWYHLQHFSPFYFYLSNRGLISLNTSDTYYLEPISNVDPVRHSLMSAKELPIKGGNCGHSHHTTHLDQITELLRPFHSRVSLTRLKKNVFLGEIHLFVMFFSFLK